MPFFESARSFWLLPAKMRAACALSFSRSRAKKYVARTETTHSITTIGRLVSHESSCRTRSPRKASTLSASADNACCACSANPGETVCQNAPARSNAAYSGANSWSIDSGESSPIHPTSFCPSRNTAAPNSARSPNRTAYTNSVARTAAPDAGSRSLLRSHRHSGCVRSASKSPAKNGSVYEKVA